MENVPDMLPSNVRKLKAAYRHPFEYINPRLYQKRSPSAKQLEVINENFFVENEEEFQALQDTNDTAVMSKRSDL